MSKKIWEDRELNGAMLSIVYIDLLIYINDKQWRTTLIKNTLLL